MVELGYVEGEQIRSFRDQMWEKSRCTWYEYRYTDVFGSRFFFQLSPLHLKGFRDGFATISVLNLSLLFFVAEDLMLEDLPKFC